MVELSSVLLLWAGVPGCLILVPHRYFPFQLISLFLDFQLLEASDIAANIPSGEDAVAHVVETETVEPCETEEDLPTGRSASFELESDKPVHLSPPTRESVADARAKGFFEPRFPRVRQIELSDRSVERNYSRAGRSCHSHRYLLIDLLHNGWHLPEFALFFNFYADHPVSCTNLFILYCSFNLHLYFLY